MGVHRKNVAKHKNRGNEQMHKEDVGEPFPEFTALLKGD